MWRLIKQKILQIRKAAGIEVLIMSDESLHINGAIAETKKNNVIKTGSFSNLKHLQGIIQKVEKSIPLSLVINGKAVLLKKADKTETSTTLSSVLPNANPDDFYYEKFQGKYFDTFSIVRKETVNKIISELKALGYKVVSVSLGFTAIENILPFLNNNKETQIETDSTIIEIDSDNDISNIKVKEVINNMSYNANEYLVANQYINPPTVLAFSAATGLLADNIQSSSSVNLQALSPERSEFKYYKFFKAGVISLLTVLFSILLINFLIYNYYFNKNKNLETSSLFTTQQEHKINALETEIKKKERFLQQSGWSGNSKTSFFADRIASLAPEEILLTSMQIYPSRNGSSSESVNSSFKQNTIVVSGRCENPTELNKFMNNLKILSDFKEVVIKNYQYRNEKEIGSFLMEIITK